MNIAMFTNAYEPIIGGQEQSVATFAGDLRDMGHPVLVVTLAFPGAEASDERTMRLPALKKVGGTEFSVKMPVPVDLKDRLDDFSPDVVHSHHPFMLGDTALRVARRRALPLVFTHHTLYERYTYMFSRESEMLRGIAAALPTEYANLCDLVVAPTQSIEKIIRRRGVTVPVEVIPTGIDVEVFQSGRGDEFRRRHGIPDGAFVLGYLGRVVEVKNMDFLARAAARFLSQNTDAWYLVVGEGESLDSILNRFQKAGVADRVVATGSLTGSAVADAYAAMDLFAFASSSDTQGIVLIESFCAGVPVVALDATGARDIVQDGRNGALLDSGASPEQFAHRLLEVSRDTDLLSRWSESARERAGDFDRGRCAGRLLEAYGRAAEHERCSRPEESQLWPALQKRFAAEWDLFTEKLSVLLSAIASYDRPDREK